MPDKLKSVVEDKIFSLKISSTQKCVFFLKFISPSSSDLDYTDLNIYAKFATEEANSYSSAEGGDVCALKS